MIAYFDCFSGASGDMILGALVDAGLDLGALDGELAKLNVTGYRLRSESVVSKGISGTRVHVELTEHDHAHRHLSDIVAIVSGSGLSATAKEKITTIFKRLAVAEAKVHGVTPEEIHFHEVGAIDAIVDISGAVVGLEMLSIDKVYCSALPTGGGTIRAAHGVLPVPAPATLELMREASAPLRPMAVEAELVTPTGAAILTTLGEFTQPQMALKAIGHGFGQKELPWANVLRLWLGEPAGGRGNLDADTAVVIETNIDDMPGEILGQTMERLLSAGALDVFFTPIQMKKNRPAVMLSVISSPDRVSALAQVILAETSTLGVRTYPVSRVKSERWQEKVDTIYGPVLAKVKRVGQTVTFSPEYDDAARVAREKGVPLQDVYAAVAASAQARRGGAPGQT